MIKLGIICGCLPTQAGIEKHELYHQLLADKYFQKSGEQLIISSIWYTTIAGSVDMVRQLIENEDPDIILYHVRPDPYLRVSKLFIRYRNSLGKIKFIFNLNANDKFISEKKYSPRNSLPLRETSKLKIFFRNINYILGYAFGSNTMAISIEHTTIQGLINLCRSLNKKLIIIGPASRPRSQFENYLLTKLERILSNKFKNDSANYITCLGTKGINNEDLFREDGVHVSKQGHSRIAALIEPVLLEIINEISIIKN